ncbi:MAG: histone [Candidatus Aenigmatarchaeota archaeon]
MGELTMQPFKRILKSAGARRVSDEAAQALADYIEMRATEIFADAQKLAEISGRRTVVKEDIRIIKTTSSRNDI